MDWSSTGGFQENTGHKTFEKEKQCVDKDGDVICRKPRPNMELLCHRRRRMVTARVGGQCDATH
jgi:hypothetical protein